MDLKVFTLGNEYKQFAFAKGESTAQKHHTQGLGESPVASQIIPGSNQGPV